MTNNRYGGMSWITVQLVSIETYIPVKGYTLVDALPHSR